MLSRTKKGLIIAALSGLMLAPGAHAASGSTQIDIEFAPFVILYYFDNIDVTVSATDMGSLMMAGASCNSVVGGIECAANTDPKVLTTATVSSTTATFDADITTDGMVTTALETDLTIKIDNAWAVRSLATTLTASIAVSGGGDFTNVSLLPTAPTASLTLTDGSNVGDIQFDIDMSGAISGDTFSDTLTITVTGV